MTVQTTHSTDYHTVAMPPTLLWLAVAMSTTPLWLAVAMPTTLLWLAVAMPTTPLCLAVAKSSQSTAVISSKTAGFDWQQSGWRSSTHWHWLYTVPAKHSTHLRCPVSHLSFFLCLQIFLISCLLHFSCLNTQREANHSWNWYKLKPGAGALHWMPGGHYRLLPRFIFGGGSFETGDDHLQP